jgi:glucans biosynthesis protein
VYATRTVIMNRANRAAATGALLLLAVVTFAVPEAHAFGLDDVAARAAKLAASPYQRSTAALPKALKALDYDQFRDIRFRPERAMWRGTKLPFEIMFFHRAWLYEEPVTIHEVTAEGAREIAFDPDDFDYGRNTLDRNELRGLRFAGFRVHFPVNTPTYKDEVLVFLGASYFRGLGRGQRFGLSARGLAIDTAESTGEEFPRFVEYWIERPPPAARELVVYALLDSPRATGAYRFVLKPGVTTALEVDSRLFLRKNVVKLGLAPLTSMFYFGGNQRAGREDYRPRVHDSDGLSIREAGDRWIWRPLVNPKRLLVTSFALDDPAGFGLMQRQRDFGQYQDLEARYDLRPSAWIEPKGSWGAGRVELVQIPVPDETNDNVVAYWVPDRQPKAGEPFAYGYRVLWQKEQEARPSVGWVSDTRRGRGYTKNDDGSIELHVDFEGPTLSRMPWTAIVDTTSWADANAEVLERRTQRNGITGGWRFVVRFRRLDRGKPVELRAHLHRGSEVLSETWNYILPPD